MKSRVIWVTLCVLILLSLILVSCAETTTSTKTSTTQQTTLSSTTSVTTTANWWDKFGTPQYGGSITYVSAGLMGVNFDTYLIPGSENSLWFETLFEPDWTLNPDTWFMSGNFAPDQYYSGNLADTWEYTDATTITVQIRQGVLWQNKAPVNGREFTAYDVAAHYNRVLGFDGVTPMGPMYAGSYSNWESVTATGKYTVVFKFKAASAQNFQSMADRFTGNQFESPEFAAMTPAEGSNVDPRQDQANAVGTGPWMLVEYVDGSGFTYTKNPDYWGWDPRHPENPTPYVNTLSLVIIQDVSSRVAAIRTGQVDTMGGGGNTVIEWQQAEQILETNPDMQSAKVSGGAVSIVGRMDRAPFTDVRVRQALNMAINRKAIADSIYGGTTEGLPVGLVSTTLKGYAFAYDEWPQSLKDEYAYDPTVASQLLAEAAADGVFTANADGGFDTNVVTSQANTELLQIFQSYFAEIGVNMKITVMDTVALEAYIRDQQFDQMASGGAAQSFPPTRIVDLAYSKGTDATLFGLVNNADANYDALRDEFWAATDSTEAMSIMQQMDEYFLDNHWAVAGPERYSYVMWQPWLKGYSGEGTQWNQGVLWSRLWIDESLK